ncbi:MAG: PGPGW domain-containing protein [Pseudomonadota bacterium]
MNKKFRRLARRIGIAIAGGAVILAGVVLSIPLVPGPGFLLILMGLGILSLEFERPRIWLARIKEKGLALKDWFKRWRSRSKDGS